MLNRRLQQGGVPTAPEDSTPSESCSNVSPGLFPGLQLSLTSLKKHKEHQEQIFVSWCLGGEFSYLKNLISNGLDV
jgi:hypothetical protein